MARGWSAGGEDGHVYVWEASAGHLLLRLAGHQGAVTSVAWSPDGSRLASGGGSRDSGEIFVWDIQSWAIGTCLGAAGRSHLCAGLESRRQEAGQWRQ